VVPPADVASLADKLKQQRGITITHRTVEGAGHFFDPGMEEMIATVEAYVRQRLTETSR
jgi:alpha/beta superfamily hydrolase